MPYRSMNPFKRKPVPSSVPFPGITKDSITQRRLETSYLGAKDTQVGDLTVSREPIAITEVQRVDLEILLEGWSENDRCAIFSLYYQTKDKEEVPELCEEEGMKIAPSMDQVYAVMLLKMDALKGHIMGARRMK
ncbi:MAG: hypothetical protein M4579_001676 [Chaenotheca gracillima]|nr:MAG: hypothetical protein M4579_001676 [Chaenotheca gracillima]